MAGEHDIRAVEVRVRGLVQGVGYRFGALHRAAALDVAGWIRNEDNGDVLAHLEGLGYRVDSLLEWMREGSPSAQVTRVDMSSAAVEGWDGFTLR